MNKKCPDSMRCLHSYKKCNLCIEYDLFEEKYHYFWNGPFSQWAKFSMTDPITGITFNCCEQYMMYKKAMLFGDDTTAAKILCTLNPKDQKLLGRQVSGYNEITWDAVKIDIVFSANVLKYSQNEEARIALLETGNKELVEASPYDKVWGIGLNEEDARKAPPSAWRGQNLLGKVLTSVKSLYK